MLTDIRRGSLLLPVAFVVLCCGAHLARAAGSTIWYTGNAFVGPSGTIVTPGLDWATIQFNSTAPVVLELNLPGGIVVDSVTVCYSTSNTAILTTRLEERVRLGGSITRLSDGAFRNSASPTCYSLDVTDFTPDGGLMLTLAPFTSGAVVIYSIGIKVRQATVAVEDQTRTGDLLELRNAPNPFGGGTTIEYSLDRPGATSLKVFDIAGRDVRTLVAGDQGAGEHRVLWDGRDDRGLKLEHGVYFYELATPNGRGARQTILLR